MKVEVPSGKYVLAVSGGVDSMVLLDLLAKQDDLDLVVGHFNHNIREDSGKDEELVKKTAMTHGYVFEAGQGNLSRNTSEEAARAARYGFLSSLKAKYAAKAIITAHHQDDVIETALINLIRGTNRSGLSAIINNKQILRPLLKTSKLEIRAYAKKHKLEWRDDSTNQNTDYLRNYLRLKVLNKLTERQRTVLISNIEKVAITNMELDKQIATISQKLGEGIDRQLFSSLPADVGKELLVYRLKQEKIKDFDSQTINRLNMSIRTSKANSTQPVKQDVILKVDTKTAYLVTP